MYAFNGCCIVNQKSPISNLVELYMFTFFERLATPFPNIQPPASFTSLPDFIRQYTKGLGRYFILLAVLSACVSIIELSLFRLLGAVVDWMEASTRETLFQQYGTKLFWATALVIVIYPLCLALQNLISNQVLVPSHSMRIRWLAHKHLLSQSYSFYQNEYAGRIVTKVMQTADASREAVMKLFGLGVYIFISFGGVLLLVGSLDLRLALPFLVWLICYLALLGYFLPRLGAVATGLANARSEMTGRLVDTYTNFLTVKLFSHDQHELGYAKESMQAVINNLNPQMRLATLLSMSLCLLNCTLLLSVTGFSLWLWTESLITTGASAAATALVLRLFGMSQWAVGEVASLFQHLGTAQDGMAMLASTQEIVDVESAGELQKPSANIEFKNVRFNYGKPWGADTCNKRPILDDFTLTIASGEKIGLVGISGAGKSTVVNLLLRFFDPEAGSILIGEQDICGLKQESLRSNIGMVTQDPSLLHRTIEENLLYGNPQATHAEMMRAAEQARAHDFISDLSDTEGNTGYKTLVGERGIKLSGGQRQRIAIARVLLKNAPILVLDEATSALDSEVEAAIQDNLQTLMKGKTVIVIAHRLSTIAALDRLVVIDKGRVVEVGTHQQLLDLSGIYAQLWARQSGGFIGE